MRIISGALKGKTINFVKNFDTRPLKDSVRESIFNILHHSNLININFEKANILDMYSGIGSFGIECISRGAKKVTFIEQNKNSAKILEHNLTNLSIIDYANLFNNSVEKILKENTKQKFDIFFLDPPFLDQSFTMNLKYIKKNLMYKKNHIIIIHREKKTEDNLTNFFNIIKTKIYGRSKIIFGVFT